MIRYPKLPENYSIGITAPSSGIEIQLHYILQEVKRKFESNHQLIIGDSTYVYCILKVVHYSTNCR